ncbi:MAG TPA: 4,5-DOPA dioxygenase extradiol [Steroidobacteraceae bacterium]|nr:4,5-DOPA dioxygenase extradiol [Steroidobacteraceae bacterium]
MTELMPAVFFGHGNPMYALEPNSITEGWSRVAASLPRPRAVLAISAHWFVPGTAVTANERPRTIHDFGGFPRELYQVQYPAPGSADLARRVQELITQVPVSPVESWGLDHGTWSVLKYMYPGADVPVVQLSLDDRQSPAAHFALGAQLAPLRREGILLMGSGNLVHNIEAYAWGQHLTEPYDWAARFETQARRLIESADTQALIEYRQLGPDAALAIPTPDHYLPLLYVLGSRQPDEPVSFPVEGFDGGSVSMLAVRVG